MNMKLKSLSIIVVIVLTTLGLSANSTTFLQDGRTFSGTLLDISSRTGMVEYFGNTKINRAQIWMINFADNNWDFEAERNQLSNQSDTIFLHNGQTMNVRIVDFSSRRKIFEFQGGGNIHISNVKRIYFCCVPLPEAYRQLLRKAPPETSNRYAAIFMTNGNVVESPISYLNSSKTGFLSGLEINSKDIWQINLEDAEWDNANDRRQLDRQLDTIFLKNGRVIFDTVVDFSKNRNTFRFENIDPIHESQISRIYFCCGDMPEAYRNRSGNRNIKRNRDDRRRRD